MVNELPLKKVSDSKEAYYEDELRVTWIKFHEPDIKIVDVWNWSTHQVGDGGK